MKKKDIIEMMVAHMKSEMLFNYNFYSKPQEIVELYYRYIKKYPDNVQYLNMRKTTMKALMVAVQNEKSYLNFKREDTQIHDIILLPLLNVVESKAWKI
jgi:hypothetical protein